MFNSPYIAYPGYGRWPWPSPVVTDGTISPENPSTPTIDDLQKALDSLKKLKSESKWILTAPDGRVFTGNPNELIMTLAKESMPAFTPYPYMGTSNESDVH